MSIKILMQRLWVTLITTKWVEAVERAGGWIVETGSQILLSIGLGPFAAGQNVGQCVGCVGEEGVIEHLAIRCVGVGLCDLDDRIILSILKNLQ